MLRNLSKARSIYHRNLYEQTMVVYKGKEYAYNSTISLVYSLDLSSNNLSGEILDKYNKARKIG